MREQIALFRRIRLTEPLPEPVGQLRLFRLRQGGPATAKLGGPAPLVCGQCRLDFAQAEAHLAQRRRDREMARCGVLRQRPERAQPAQHREHALGDEGAVALAHLGMAPEELVKCAVGRFGERQHDVERVRQRTELTGAQAARVG